MWNSSFANSTFQIPDSWGRRSRDRRPFLFGLVPMTILRSAAAALLAACLACTLAAQPVATLTLVKRASEPLPFSNPFVKISGTIRPLPGNRLDLVVVTVGEMPVETDIRSFALVAADGATYEPIAAGGGPDLIFPIESLELGRELGQILPTAVEVLMRRTSTASVTLAADPGATLAFVFQVPERVSVRALRLPGGSELALAK
jgi:hypothetical protein